jgi:hypothetical protein
MHALPCVLFLEPERPSLVKDSAHQRPSLVKDSAGSQKRPSLVEDSASGWFPSLYCCSVYDISTVIIKI